MKVIALIDGRDIGLGFPTEQQRWVYRVLLDSTGRMGSNIVVERTNKVDKVSNAPVYEECYNMDAKIRVLNIAINRMFQEKLLLC